MYAVLVYVMLCALLDCETRREVWAECIQQKKKGELEARRRRNRRRSKEEYVCMIEGREGKGREGDRRGSIDRKVIGTHKGGRTDRHTDRRMGQ
jgi:hypothetical protein